MESRLMISLSNGLRLPVPYAGFHSRLFAAGSRETVSVPSWPIVENRRARAGERRVRRAPSDHACFSFAWRASNRAPPGRRGGSLAPVLALRRRSHSRLSPHPDPTPARTLDRPRSSPYSGRKGQSCLYASPPPPFHVNTGRGPLHKGRAPPPGRGLLPHPKGESECGPRAPNLPARRTEGRGAPRLA